MTDFIGLIGFLPTIVFFVWLYKNQRDLFDFVFSLFLSAISGFGLGFGLAWGIHTLIKLL